MNRREEIQEARDLLDDIVLLVGVWDDDLIMADAELLLDLTKQFVAKTERRVEIERYRYRISEMEKRGHEECAVATRTIERWKQEVRRLEGASDEPT